MKSNYKKILCGLIPLISIVLLAPLAQSKAEQGTSDKEPQLSLEVLGWSIKVVIPGTSVAPDHRLVLRVKSGEVYGACCITTTGYVVLYPGKGMSLRALLDKGGSPTEYGTQTLHFVLIHGKSNHAEPVFSIEDAKGNSVGEPLSVFVRETKTQEMVWAMARLFLEFSGMVFVPLALLYWVKAWLGTDR